MPAPEVREWIVETFVAEGAPLGHAEHSHLRHAHLATAWTNCEYTRKGRRVLGQASLGMAPHGVYGWDRARMKQQMRRWFSGWFDGSDPDFLILLFGPYVHERRAQEDAVAICGLVEHELLHCGQATDKHGAPKFDDATGRPQFTIRGHDAECFAHEVRRYGAHTEGLEKIRKAFRDGPTAPETTVRGVCGCGAPVKA